MSRKARGSDPVPRRVAFVVNPVAGGGRALRGYRGLRDAIGRGAVPDDFISGAPGEAADIAARAVVRGYDAVFAVGGDGTLHEVVNGLFRAGMRDGTYRGPPLGLLPLGRGNDFARTFGIRGSLADIWRAQQRNLGANPRRIDVGRASIADDAHSHFVNMCGMGFDADVAATANRVPRFLGGVLPYLAGILLHFTVMRSHALEVTLTDIQPVDGADAEGWPEARSRQEPNGRTDVTVRENLLLALTGIGQFIGCGMKLLPHARPDDGYLDVMLVRPVGRLHFLGTLRSSFTGGHLAQTDVAYYRAARVDIRGATRANIHADGDHIGRGVLTVDVLPRALPVLF